MSRFFSLDNPVILFLSRITDLILLSILWIICCIPIVTIIPSTSALYYITLKMVRNEDSRLAVSFFRAFADNLKKGTVLSIVLELIGILIYVDYLLSGMVDGGIGTVLRIFFLILCITYCAFFHYTAALQAKFENTIVQTMKNAVILLLRFFGKTLRILIINATPIALVLLFPELTHRILPIWIILVPATVVFLCAKQFVLVFDKVLAIQNEPDTQDE
ncbi:MAG: YesL family protein [Clostridia bacterium]|nr:YesL family protein [Clostridia bacterium]